jgi:hypothetical protein
MFFNPEIDNSTLGDWPTNNPNSRPPNWLTVFNSSVGLASQAIAAWGRSPSTQVASGYNSGVFTIQAIHPANFDDRLPMSPYPQYQTAQNATVLGQGVYGPGSTIGGGIDGIFNWLLSNPLITFGGIAALFLLFREPPRRR